MAVDLLTTNETYFFREAKYFDFLRNNILAHHKKGQPFRAWSAASSSGQEAYTIAMVLGQTAWATSPGRWWLRTSARRCWSGRAPGITRWNRRAISRKIISANSV